MIHKTAVFTLLITGLTVCPWVLGSPAVPAGVRSTLKLELSVREPLGVAVRERLPLSGGWFARGTVARGAVGRTSGIIHLFRVLRTDHV